jgi:lysophospholipase L1-like esterase
MSMFGDLSKPVRGVESGEAAFGPMAHADPRVSRASRPMAHPIHRGPLGWLRRTVEGLTAGSGRVGIGSGGPPSAGRLSLENGWRRDLAVVLALLLAATAVSASLPGGWAAATANPSPSPLMVAAAITSSPTPTDSPTPEPTAEPTATPTLEPTATPTPKPTPTKAPAKTPRVYTFVALGDSLTYGYNDPGPAWPTRLDTLDANLHALHNAGVPGDLTSGMLSRLNRDVFAYSPNVLFVLGGTNDLGTGVSQATTIANLKAIIVKAQARGIKVFLISVPPNSSSVMTAPIDSLNAAIQHLANVYKLYMIDIHTPLSGSNGLIQSKYTVDGLHFNGAGAQLVAVTIYNRIHRLGY